MHQSEEHSLHAEFILAGIDGGNSVSRYQTGQIVYSQGDPAVFVFYVQTGKLKVAIVSDEGKEAVVTIHLPGNFCGEECLTGHKLRMATVTALTECKLVKMPKAVVIRALYDDPEFSKLFTTYLMERNIRGRQDLVDQLLNSTEKRLARLLLILANYGKEDRPNLIVPKVNQKMLAEMIGASRSHVSFFMNKFRRLGLIEYNSDPHCEIRVNGSLLNLLLHERAQNVHRD